jgi:predicted house-cleaning noncanonical NTP pyrophosphatase (MazG superfamily)
MTKPAAKLVRDKIPEIIRQDGRVPVIRIIEGTTLVDALNTKLLEEHQEFLSAHDDKAKLEELADLMEVVFGLAKQFGATREDLLILADQKRDARGGFDQGYFFEGCQ